MEDKFHSPGLVQKFHLLCLNSETHLNTDCVTAAWPGCPILKNQSDASFHPWETKAPMGGSSLVQPIPGSVLLQWRTVQWLSISHFSPTQQIMVHTKNTWVIKMFSLCPTSALLSGNSNKWGMSWWHLSQRASFEQRDSFQFGLRGLCGSWWDSLNAPGRPCPQKDVVPEMRDSYWQLIKS